MPGLEIISLSLNKISTLRDLTSCPNITEIYLRKNNISDLKEISHLTRLTRLRVLWLSHNPCAEHPFYRAYTIRTIPSLQKLDNAEVTAAEREQVASLNFGQIFNENPSYVNQ